MQYSQASNKILLNGLKPMDLTIEDGDHFLKSATANNKGFLSQLWTLVLGYDT